MRRFIHHTTCLLAGLLMLETPAAAVDLTPRFTETVIDGYVTRRLYFAEFEKKIGLSMDHETTVEAGSGGAVFRFVKQPDATFVITHSPLTPDQPFEGVSLDRYREAARRFLPPGAKNVNVLEEVANPLPINRWTSRRFAYTCDSGDAPMAVSVTFLNLNAGEQLLLVTTATERNFAEAAERSFQIIRSWHTLRPKDERLIKSS